MKPRSSRPGLPCRLGPSQRDDDFARPSEFGLRRSGPITLYKLCRAAAGGPFIDGGRAVAEGGYAREERRPLQGVDFLSIGLAALPLRGEASRLQWGRDMHGVYLTLSEFVKVAPAFPIEAELRKICPRNDRLAVIEAVARSRLIRGMAPPGKHVSASMVQMHEQMGNIDAIVRTESGSDLIGWCAFLDARGIPDAVFLGTPNPDGSVELLAPILRAS